MNIEKIAEGIWCFSKDWFVPGFTINFGIRMTVIEISPKKFLVLSPIVMDSQALNILKCFGDVEFILSPNLFHHMFAVEFKSYFPNAKLLGCPGLDKKRKNIHFDQIIKESIWSDIEIIFHDGSKYFKELILYHKKTKTLLTIDFGFNITPPKSIINNIFSKAFGIGSYRPSNIFKLLNSNRKVKETIQKINKLDFNKIIPAHGQYINDDAKEKFNLAFGQYDS